MSFPRYPAYKPSGVEWLGDVPEHWEVKRLKWEITEVENRAGEEALELLGLSKVHGVIPRAELEQNAQESNDYSKYRVTNPGELVMNRMQAWNGVFGVSPQKGMVSPDYAVFRFLRSESASYLSELFRTPLMSGVFFTRCRGMGTAFLRLNTPDFLDITVPLPPLAEQTAIAAFLDRETGKIDALVAEQRRLMELLKEKRQAVISHAVTRGLNPQAKLKPSGIDWLGDVPEHWRVGKAGFYLTILSGYAFGSSGFSDDDSHTKLLRGINVGVSRLKWDETVYWERKPDDGLDEYEMKEGDLVIGMDRPLIAEGIRVAKVKASDLPCLLLQRVASLKTGSELNADYLLSLLSSEMFVAHFAPETTGVSVPHISPEQIYNFIIPIPPLAEQTAIVAHLERELAKFDTLTAEAQRAIDLLQERRTALISAAVTGQIDVRGLAPITLPAPRLHLHPPLHGRVPGAEEMQAFWRGADPADLPENPAVVVVMDWLSRMADVRGFEPALARLGLTHDQVMDEVFQPAENGDFRPLEQAHPLVLMQCLWRIGVQIERGGYHDNSGLVLSDDFCAMNVFWATLRRKLLAKDCQPPLVFETVGW